MIKQLKSGAYKDMSKFDAFKLLHEYLSAEANSRIRMMIDSKRFEEGDWVIRQQVLVAELKYINKIKGFLPNQGKTEDDGSND